MENGNRLQCLLTEEKIYEVILEVVQRVIYLPGTEIGSVWFCWRYFSLKTAQVVVVSAMTEMLMRLVGWIIYELDGCRKHCSIHSLYLTNSNRAPELGASEDIDQGDI